ncbi:MAG: hypothetical protein EBU54_15470, partial [Mycobacteriaceae bacterium]|nr:hypothetical protein [Mycobacteriaceae bacterium]
DGAERALIRNYDYHPDLFERVVMSTRFADRAVIGTSDCLWGLLDGMNSDGLAVSLTFGGAKGSGPGFGIPLVVRYLLEVAGTTAEALAALARIPVSMSYNLTLTDRKRDTRTVYLAPAGAMEVRDVPLATNHRFDRPSDPAHAARYRSVERQDHLRDLLTRQLKATATDSARSTPRTTVPTAVSCTIAGPAPRGPDPSTPRTVRCGWTCPRREKP